MNANFMVSIFVLRYKPVTSKEVVKTLENIRILSEAEAATHKKIKN